MISGQRWAIYTPQGGLVDARLGKKKHEAWENASAMKGVPVGTLKRMGYDARKVTVRVGWDN